MREHNIRKSLIDHVRTSSRSPHRDPSTSGLCIAASCIDRFVASLDSSLPSVDAWADYLGASSYSPQNNMLFSLLFDTSSSYLHRSFLIQNLCPAAQCRRKLWAHLCWVGGTHTGFNLVQYVFTPSCHGRPGLISLRA